MNQSQLQHMYANQNVRKMLDIIAEAEGVQHGYNTLFGNQRFNNLAMHPNVRKEFTQTDGRKNYTTAAGRYQFLNNTWNGLAKQYGFKDFSPQNQDLGAIALLAQNGALPYVLKGDFTTAVQKSGGTWASLPSSTYAQNKRGWDFVNKRLGGSAPQQRQLTLADLEKQYGKGKEYVFEQQQAPQGLTVAELERMYGKGQEYQF